MRPFIRVMAQSNLQSKVPDGRIYDRADIAVEVDVSSEHNFYLGFSENISEGGIFIATHILREVGTKLKISFTMPTCEEAVEIEGVVRWLRVFCEESDTPPGLGIEFENLSESATEAIRTFVRGRKPFFYDSD